jgi:hypothetical protein
MKLRRGQLVIPFGVGAVVNLPGESVMQCSARLWPQTGLRTIYDERLQRRLNISYFKMPPSEEEVPLGLPFVRFPRWLRCPKCKRFRPVQDWACRWRAGNGAADVDTPRCIDDNAGLIPSRFIVACKAGHVDDFPWVYWAHAGHSCGEPDLRLETGHGGGLSGIRVICTTCKCEETMAHAFDPGVFERLGMPCSGEKPWDRTSQVRCTQQPVTLQRGASNVYFPRIATSIYIPPFTDDLWERIRATDEWAVISTSDMNDDGALQEALIGSIARKLGLDINIVRSAVAGLRVAAAGVAASISELDYRYQEYVELSSGTAQKTRNFTTEPMPPSSFTVRGLTKVVLESSTYS